MNFSICVDALYNKKDFYEGMKEVKELGYKAIEFWSWWDKDIPKLIKTKEELGLEISTFCTRFISLNEEATRADYINALKESIATCKSLGCKSLITQVGNDVLSLSRAEQIANIIKGLKEAAPLLEEADITLLVEPLNIKVDHKGYFLSSSKEAFQIIKEVGSPKVKVLYDIYHQQITEGNLIPNIEAAWSEIAAFHLGDNPGRNEPTTGEINFKNVFKYIYSRKYEGVLCMEHGMHLKGKEGEARVIQAYRECDNFEV